jgi:hypothetical protein
MRAHRSDEDDVALIPEHLLGGMCAHETGCKINVNGMTHTIARHGRQGLGGNGRVDDDNIGTAHGVTGGREKASICSGSARSTLIPPPARPA